MSKQKADMRQAAYKAWRTTWKRTYNFTDEELLDFIQERYQEQTEADQRKRVREVIRLLGGIKDSDYEYIPHWARRKNGRPLDELVISVSEYGYNVEDANGLYELILNAGVK